MNARPKIDNRLAKVLPTPVQGVLRAMFADYQEVIVRKELTGGMSGSRVLVVRPIRPTGPELPVVVKIDTAAAILQEWEGYKSCIQNRLPSVAEIQGEPVFPPGSPLGGLRYGLAGEGVFEVVSLADYLRQKPLPEVTAALDRLFRVMGTLWDQKDVKPDLYLQTTYDSFLPVNLVVKFDGDALSSEHKWLDPTTARKTDWEVGDLVQLSGFQPVEINAEKGRVMLNSPDPALAFRFYLNGLKDVSPYAVGQPISQPLTGVIQETRHDFLNERVRALLGDDLDLAAPTLSLEGGLQLPNPLAIYPEVLAKYYDANMACIHGDLHLENILVEPDGGLSYLIDFGKSGRDHVIRDLIHMEISLMTSLLPEILGQDDFSPALLADFYWRLHCAVLGYEEMTPPAGLARPFAVLRQIRLTAQHYLLKPERQQEYYYSLGLSLLSTLKFNNLSPMARQVAFWGAAVAFDLGQRNPDCAEMKMEAEPLEVDAGALVGGVKPASNLPPKAYHQLIGRAQEQETILSALRLPDKRPIVVIVGLGGMGKTALAREVMAQCQQDDFFIHTVWTSAKTEHFIVGKTVRGEEIIYDLDTVLGDIGRQCQRLDIATMPLEQKKAAVAHLLASQRSLIVLDNLETVPEKEHLVQELHEILGASKLLVTSRHQVEHEMAFTVNLGGFPEEDGISFLRTEGRERNITAVTEAPFQSLLEIHQKSGGAPLAMKLVVGQLDSQPMAAVLASLQEASARGQDYEFYRFVYWYSWGLLNDNAQMALVDMSVFPPMIGGAAADVAAVSQLETSDFWPAIGQLVTMSLVDKFGLAGQERYALHALTHYFILADITEEWAD